MNYDKWRDDIFGKPEGYDPVVADLLEETSKLSEIEHLDFIDRALQDPDVHIMYSQVQIGIGLNIIYSNTCSEVSYCYVEKDENSQGERRKIESIKCLQYLYTNFFSRYCNDAVVKIGDSTTPNYMNFICYMLWDIFVLYPGNATTKMVEASVEMMEESLNIRNDNCLVSLIHGLGHWVPDTSLAAPVLDKWLISPTTKNEVVINYAIQAKTGYIQ